MENLILVHSADICHYGIKGQKWGERKYQYEDGRLTPLGREHYGKKAGSALARATTYEINSKDKVRKGLNYGLAIAGGLASAHSVKSKGGSNAIAALAGTTSTISGLLGIAAGRFLGKKIAQKSQRTWDEITSKYGKEIAKDYIDKYNNLSNYVVQQKYKDAVNEKYRTSK